MSAKCHKRTLQYSPHQATGAALVIQVVAARIERTRMLVEMMNVCERPADLAQAHALTGLGTCSVQTIDFAKNIEAKFCMGQRSILR